MGLSDTMTIQLFLDLRMPRSMNRPNWSTSVDSSGMMAASIVALKCLNLVPDLAAWMIPEGDTAFSTRNFGEGVAQQAKVSTQGMLSKVM